MDDSYLADRGRRVMGSMEWARAGIKLACWFQIPLFCLNLAWVVVWFALRSEFMWFYLHIWHHAHWPVPVLFWRSFWMPEPPWVLGQVVLSFVVATLICLPVLLAARWRPYGTWWCSVPVGFAIAAYPLLALRNSSSFFPPPQYVAGHESWLILETAAVVAFGLLYCGRRYSNRRTLLTLMILLHFCLWGWVTHSYVNPVSEFGAYPRWHWPVGEVGFGVCISMIFHFGFPVIGFLSASTSGLCPKPAGGQKGCQKRCQEVSGTGSGTCEEIKSWKINNK